MLDLRTCVDIIYDSCPPGTVALSPRDKVHNTFSESYQTEPLYIQPGHLFVLCSDKLTLNNSQCLVQNFTNCWGLDFQNVANSQKKFLVSQEGDDVLAETWDGAGNALTKHIAANGLEANFTFTTVISQTCLGAEKWGSELPELR